MRMSCLWNLKRPYLCWLAITLFCKALKFLYIALIIKQNFSLFGCKKFNNPTDHINYTLIPSFSIVVSQIRCTFLKLSILLYIVEKPFWRAWISGRYSEFFIHDSQFELVNWVKSKLWSQTYWKVIFLLITRWTIMDSTSIEVGLLIDIFQCLPEKL